MTLQELAQRQDLATNFRTRRPYFYLMNRLSHERSAIRTLEILEGRRLKRKALVDSKRAERGIFTRTESGKGEMKMSGSENVHQNVISYDGEQVEPAPIGPPRPSVEVGAAEVHPLNDFLSRPLTIYDSTWTISTEYNVALRVWDLFTKDSTVRAKLSNYSYLRGNLHVKISFSATPFHYGTVMLAYFPYPDVNDILLSYDDLLVGTNPNPTQVLRPYKAYASQQPGVRYIRITDNQPVEMVIPFLSPRHCDNTY
jgi:hypothetical protein